MVFFLRSALGAIEEAESEAGSLGPRNRANRAIDEAVHVRSAPSEHQRISREFDFVRNYVFSEAHQDLPIW